MKLMHVKPATLAKMPAELSRLVAEWQTDYMEFAQNWGALTPSEQSLFLKQNGKNGHFQIEGQEVAVTFLADESEELINAISLMYPEAVKDWENVPDEELGIPLAAEEKPKPEKPTKEKPATSTRPKTTKDKPSTNNRDERKDIQTMLDGYSVMLKYANDESEKSDVDELMKGLRVLLKYLT